MLPVTDAEVEALNVRISEKGIANLGTGLLEDGPIGSDEYAKKFCAALTDAYERLSFMHRVTSRPSIMKMPVVNERVIRIQMPKEEFARVDQEQVSVEFFIGMLSGLFGMDREFIQGLAWRLKAGDKNVARVELPLSLNSMAIAREVFRVNNRPCAANLASTVAWSECIGSDAIRACMDMKSRYADLMNGEVAVLFGAEVYSDAFHHPDLRILPESTIWFLESPERVGFFDFEVRGLRETPSGIEGLRSFELSVDVVQDLVPDSVASLLVLK